MSTFSLYLTGAQPNVRYGIGWDGALRAFATLNDAGTWQIEPAAPEQRVLPAGEPAVTLTDEERDAITTARLALRRISGG